MDYNQSVMFSTQGLLPPRPFHHLPGRDVQVAYRDEVDAQLPKVATKRTRAARLCEVKQCTRKVQSKGRCVAHGGGRRCEMEGCTRKVQSRGLCITHGGGRRCNMTGCSNSAKGGGFCKSHGGGRRCQFENCAKSAASRGLCIMHGGGKRCEAPGCTKSAQNKGYCISHGGARFCAVSGCKSKSRSRGLCILHGGGKRCKVEGCSHSAQSGGKCIGHGGGRRCSVESCTNSAKADGVCTSHAAKKCKFGDCNVIVEHSDTGDKVELYCAAHRARLRAAEAPVRAVTAPLGNALGYAHHPQVSSEFLSPPGTGTGHMQSALTSAMSAAEIGMSTMNYGLTSSFPSMRMPLQSEMQHAPPFNSSWQNQLALLHMSGQLPRQHSTVAPGSPYGFSRQPEINFGSSLPPQMFPTFGGMRSEHVGMSQEFMAEEKVKLSIKNLLNQSSVSPADIS